MFTTYSTGDDAIQTPITIRSCKITVDSSGTPKVAPVFRNDSDEDILAFTFEMQCFDKEGRFIVGYGSRQRNWADYEHVIKPGKLSRQTTWINSGREGARTIYIAISSYTKADGRTVTIPQDQLYWVKFTK